MKKVGLIGIGAIGSYLYERLLQDGVEVVFVCASLKVQGQPYSDVMIDSIEELEVKCQQGLDLVVEAATFAAVQSYAPVVLKYADMAILSSTALADETFYQTINDLCRQHQTRLFVPHGAVMGLDGIMDAREALKSVTITTTKTPRSLGREDFVKTVVYDGATRQACKLYPRNVNVHASTALAGMGFDKTRSVIVSDPDAKGNGHEIEVKGEGFAFKVQTMSETASKVSSVYTLISAYGAVQRILKQEGIVVV
ncbi:MAG: aspartate dehydrogenase domain-containing protein [Saezia sp.]